MLIKKAKLLLILVALAGCSTRKTVVVIPEYNILLENKNALRSDFERNVSNKVYFAFDSAMLSKEAKNLLQKQAEWLLSHPNVKATIEGHCDEKGSEAYNLALGLRRAEAVEKFLVAQGVDSNRLIVVTYGKSKPEVTSHDKETSQLNRRAVTIIAASNVI